MAKETNHRRKCKVDKVAEELDLDKLARELKKNNKNSPKAVFCFYPFISIIFP